MGLLGEKRIFRALIGRSGVNGGLQCREFGLMLSKRAAQRGRTARAAFLWPWMMPIW